MPALSQQQVDLPPRYRVVRHIANGGMATVWAAEDSLLERLVAVKVLAAAYAEDDAARRRFTREARAAARVSDHQNVVTIFDIGEHDGTAFIVMEHFAGGTVADRIKGDGVIPVPLALRWLRETASALDAAHAADIVHRDVKPGNLLLDENGRLGVGDFGIASLAGETQVTIAGQVLGTAAYLSPEQARGRAATPASDRFSLAVVAYELLCGRRPFAGDTPIAQARARVESDPITLTGHTSEAADALRWGLSRDPEDRPESASAFVDALEDSLDTAAAAPTTVMSTTRRTRRVSGPEWNDRDHPRFAREPIAVPVPAAAAAEATGRPRDPIARQRNPHRKAFMLAALTVGCIVIGAGAALIGDNGNDGGKALATPHATASRSQGAPTGDTIQRATATAQPSATAPAATPSASTPASTTTPPPTAGSTDSRSPAQLNNAGYAMLPSNPAAAVPLIQRAVDTFRSEGQTRSTDYIYSLYNLGWALRLSGHPADAIPYLQERLHLSNYKRGIVEQELKTALAAAGQPTKQHGPKHPKHPTPSPGGFPG
jgi:eukaryotic-like serine/threonine-protein kinase